MSLPLRRFMVILAVIVVVWLIVFFALNWFAFPGEPNTLFRSE